ncbi:MAG: sigma-70 family RNA polymerase sigma factor [Armatimonadetes bacterium]|nr:sigma-70 family RNA polymerase sigma factor [Armatimonadota bacterium]
MSIAYFLPRKLSGPGEDRSMARAQRSEAEVQRLVEQNKRLVDYMVNRYLKRYYVGTMERDDLVSWGMIGLVNAARAWDPARSAAFSTLACRAIERMIIRGVSREWRPDEANATLSLDALLGERNGDGSDERFVDRLADDADVEEDFLRADTGIEVRRALADLPEEQQDLIRRHYYEGQGVQEIAQDLGMSRQGIYSREKGILRRLRERLTRGNRAPVPA